MKIKTYQSFTFPLDDFSNAPCEIASFLKSMRRTLDEIEEFAAKNEECSISVHVCDDDDEYFSQYVSVNYSREETDSEKNRRLKREKEAAERKALEEKKKAEADVEDYQKMIKLAIKFGVKVTKIE